ncbi:class I adenylate-forming enzyme family protein [Actinokineospora auranticolor]|uniref:Acyl-CoA synthetase (AMP-forming)/AMP-acid ligase II n=1 Tax=Actinokineospora auranticolor TaxID=155976 RepID=A0A2S6GFV9_9PSEU|nr:class I adenylate-forming enzyme family protein [Actinokineospora auranticolor]PPK64075.1 acyl-CoA synthetase (AMP-forming)/AMP-acid ligase II [Actinokineospora auranticolor]
MGKPGDLGTLFDDLVERRTGTVVRLSRPLDVAPDFGTEYDVPALASLVRNIAGWLAAAGVRPGDRVAVVKANHWDYVLLACAAARVGAVPALLSDQLAPETLRVLLSRLSPALLVTTRAVLERAAEHGVALLGVARRAVTLEGRYPDTLPLDRLRGHEPPPPVFRDDDEPLVIHHTSGTTGVPKLVVHTNRSLVLGLAGAESTRLPVVSCRRKDTVCSAIAFAHGRAIPWTASVLWLAPKEVVIIDADDPARAEPVLRAFPPTTLEALPSTFVRWRPLAAGDGNPFAGVRLFVSTFDAMHPPTLRAFLGATRRRPLWVQVWGQTETGPLTFRFMTRRSLRATAARHPTTRNLGRPVPGRVRLRIVDPRTFKPVPRGTPGLVLVRTGTRGVDYVGERARWEAKADGEWWNTGDIGVRTRFGSYLMLDREVDFLPGESCVELEDVLEDRVPGLVECVVLGTPGRLPLPVVVTENGRLDPTSWRKALGDLPAMADPLVLQWDQIPRTGTGKVRRMELRAVIRTGQDTFGTGRWT